MGRHNEPLRARAPCSAPSAIALDARQSQLAFLQAQAAVQRFAAASRLEQWGCRGALPQTPGQKCRLNFLSAPSIIVEECIEEGRELPARDGLVMTEGTAVAVNTMSEMDYERAKLVSRRL